MKTIQEKLRLIEINVVDQGSIKDELEFLKRELTKVLYSSSGRGVVISGNSGSGKTTLLVKFLDQVKTRFKDEGIVSEPVYFETPATMKGKAFNSAFLNALGTPAYNPSEIDDLLETKQRREIKKIISSKNTRLVVMDEFQHVTERMGDSRVREISDSLKSILNSHSILLIFAGTEKVKGLLKNEQFNSRGRLLSKNYMTIENKKKFQKFRHYLMSLQEHAELSGVPFDDPSIALAIYYETRGDLRQITDIMKEAMLEAASNSRSNILKLHFVKSWRPRFIPGESQKALKGNTFNKTIDQLKDALSIRYAV